MAEPEENRSVDGREMDVRVLRCLNEAHVWSSPTSEGQRCYCGERAYKRSMETGPWTITPMREGKFHIVCDARKGVRPVMELILDPRVFDPR